MCDIFNHYLQAQAQRFMSCFFNIAISSKDLGAFLL